MWSLPATCPNLCGADPPCLKILQFSRRRQGTRTPCGARWWRTSSPTRRTRRSRPSVCGLGGHQIRQIARSRAPGKILCALALPPYPALSLSPDPTLPHRNQRGHEQDEGAGERTGNKHEEGAHAGHPQHLTGDTVDPLPARYEFPQSVRLPPPP
jgi:hypothetical protein